MSGALYLAWRYLAYHRIKSGILVASITLIVFLPAGLQVLVRESARDLTARAESTPLLVGARGSRIELVLSALYFETDPPADARYAEVARIAETGWADPIPLHARFHARSQPIVGTTLEYLDFRGLRVAAGRRFALLGECVVGARAARELGVGPGDAVLSSPETVFDLTGSYPLRMRVAGVLAPSHTPDDDAVFVDLKTAWVMQGLGHGHQDLGRPEAEAAVLGRDGDRITANASVVEYNEITPENAGSFHFHGELGEFPVTAVIARPHDAKSAVLLRGRYTAPDDPVQILTPNGVMSELLETVLTIERWVVAAISAVGVATLATASLVFLLSIRLRRREIETLVKIGGARASIATLLAGEVVFVVVVGAALAGLLTLLASRFGGTVLRSLLLS